MRKRLSASIAGLLAAGAGLGGVSPATAAPTVPGPAVQAAEAHDAGSARVTGNPPKRLSGAAEKNNLAAGTVAPKGQPPTKGGVSTATNQAAVNFLYNNALQRPPENT